MSYYSSLIYEINYVSDDIDDIETEELKRIKEAIKIFENKINEEIESRKSIF